MGVETTHIFPLKYNKKNIILAILFSFFYFLAKLQNLPSKLQSSKFHSFSITSFISVLLIIAIHWVGWGGPAYFYLAHGHNELG